MLKGMKQPEETEKLVAFSLLFFKLMHFFFPFIIVSILSLLHKFFLSYHAICFVSIYFFILAKIILAHRRKYLIFLRKEICEDISIAFPPSCT